MKRHTLAALVAACLLAACGGGGNSGETKLTPVGLKVVGASLADSGTFGLKFTVQSASGTPYAVYTERVAAAYGLSLCAHYRSSNGGVSYTTNDACFNHAVAGAAINFGLMTDSSSDADTVNDTFTPLASVPSNMLYQLSELSARGLSSGDVLIVGEGSSNDAAQLITAYLTDAQTAGTLNTTLFRQVITSLMQDGGATAGAGVLATDGGAAAGVAYMSKLAQTLVASIKTQALDKGVQRVVVLNTLDVTRTPKLQAVLGSLNATQAAQLQALFRAWVQAYNSALNTAVAAQGGKVVVVDLYAAFNDQLDNPAQYGLTNVTSTVCFETVNAAGATKTNSVVAPGTIGLTDTDVSVSVAQTCNDAFASSITPTQNATGADWWKTYAFSDSFHPTPYGHQLLAQLVNKRLAEAGWL
jgi:phospholipase/lecithinase/hemolysin